jgi:hypothetical protein
MKKLALLLLALTIVVPMFADDAKVLPAGVLRTTLVLANNSADEEFDTDGEKVDATEMKSWSAGIAVEYGATDQVSVAVQWTPAYVFSSEIEGADTTHFNGFADMFVGAKVQILGANGFVPNDMMRFAVSAGLIIPEFVYDAQEEVDNALAGDDFNITTPSNRALGFGFRLHYDYIINDMFWINLYNESKFYTESTVDVFNIPTAAEVDIKPGHEITFEVEPHLDYPVSDTLSINLGVPVTYAIQGESETNGSGDGDDGYLLSIAPNVTAFTMAPLPLEFKVGYALPLMGENSAASKTLVFQLKSYLKF